MKKFFLFLLVLGVLGAGSLSAQMKALTYGSDYTVSDTVASVTTVKVSPNRIDHYLAGLQQTWVTATKIAQEHGLNSGHAIYVSEMPESGEFNVTLVVNFDSLAQREKGNDPAVALKLRAAVEKKISEDETFEYTEGYTGIRSITGEYLMRQVVFK